MNKVVHFEIPAKDFERAKKFYSDLFGWQIQEWSGAKFRYGLSTTVASDPKTGAPSEPGGINGAVMEPTEEFEKTTMITIDVPSIDDYLSKIGTAGGKTLMPKSPVGDMGFMARFQDSEGNTVGLWETTKK